MTPPIRMVSVPVDEYGRLIEVCNGLIGELSDPGTEALAAVYCAERILHIALTAAPVREEGGAEAGERDYPAEFEAWWATYLHRNRDVADYPVKKQIAFDAFYHAARAQPQARSGEGQ